MTTPHMYKPKMIPKSLTKKTKHMTPEQKLKTIREHKAKKEKSVAKKREKQ